MRSFHPPPPTADHDHAKKKRQRLVKFVTPPEAGPLRVKRLTGTL